MSRLKYNPLVQLSLARFREFVREPEAVFWTFFFPIVLALALGVAFRNRGPEPVHIGVAAGPGADSLVQRLTAGDGIVADVMDSAAATQSLRTGRIALLVVQTDSGITYRYDPTRPESNGARLVTDDALQRGAGRTDVMTAANEHVVERGSRYIDFLIPGLIGLNLLGTGLWSVGYTVVNMRQKQLLKRMFATPLKKSHFLLSFLFARLTFLIAELGVLLLFAAFVFKVPVRGSVVSIVAFCVIGAFAFTGLGLLIASRVKTIEAVQGLMNVASVPMWILSGVFFSADNFPDVMQPFIQALPLTAVNNGLRSMMLEGTSLMANLGSVGIIIAWGIGCFAVAIGIFRWR